MSDPVGNRLCCKQTLLGTEPVAGNLYLLVGAVGQRCAAGPKAGDNLYIY
jgi:hypothetical protein